VKKQKEADSASDVALALTDFERSVLKVFDRVEIRGKRGQTVPVLLTKDMISWLDTLLACRSQYILPTNSFLFATTGDSSHLRGSDVLRKFANQCGAKKPDLLTTTKLRKNIASLGQVVCLQENELESLATFLGHDLRIHAQFYRLPSDVVQIARISKLFLAAEKGRLAEFAGKTLDQISLDDADDLENSGSESSASEVEETASGNELQQDEESAQSSVVVQKKRRIRQAVTKKHWSTAEKDSVRMHFAEFIVNKRLPRKSSIYRGCVRVITMTAKC